MIKLIVFGKNRVFWLIYIENIKKINMKSKNSINVFIIYVIIHGPYLDVIDMIGKLHGMLDKPQINILG